MPTLITHIEVALLFGVVFAIGSVILDLDHFTRCSAKNIVAAAETNNKDPAYLEENASKGGCRGSFHSKWFMIGFTALYLAFVIHMFMDSGLLSNGEVFKLWGK